MTEYRNKFHIIKYRREVLFSPAGKNKIVDPSSDSPYHRFVATKRNIRKKSKTPFGCLFLIFLLILVSGLFIINKGKIQQTLRSTQFFDQFLPTTKTQEQEPIQTPNKPPVHNTTDTKQEPLAAPEQKTTDAPLKTSTPQEPTNPKKTTTTKPKPAATVSEQPKSTVPIKTPIEKTPETKDRILYLMQLKDDGTLIQTKVTRSIKVSDSPLIDVLQLLLAGPTDSEKKRNLISAIPSGSRLLSAKVQDGTAYLNFNDAFQFNTYGLEGYTAQLKQIVWTATEFPTVQSVHILIEGKNLVYLGGEGIRIDRPLSRSSF